MTLTQVTGECEALTEKDLNELDSLTQEEAIERVRKWLRSSILARNTYEGRLLATNPDHPEYAGILHAWCIDNNNIIRFKRLLWEIENE